MELHRPMPDPAEPVCERFVLWINREYLEKLSTDQLSLSSCFDTSRPEHSHLIRPGAGERAVLTARFGELVREYYSKDMGSAISAQGAFLQLIVQLNRLAHHAGGEREGEQLSQLVSGAMQYIGEHLDSPMSLEEIAGQLFVSKYHLSHAFSAEVGISVYRYILLRRLLLARQLLAEGEPAGQVCRSCGFSDYTSFYRAFKSEYGISPREFAAS
jgi:AraC-like DNA-binding protein